MATQSSTTDYLATILYNEGEAITYDDMNAAQAVARRTANDYLWGLVYHTPGDVGAAYKLRTLRAALFTQVDSGMDLLVSAGTVIWRQTADPGYPDPRHLVINLPADWGFTVDTADGSNPRIDLISVGVAEADGDSQTRNFKDNTTGALSTQSFDKAKVVTLTITYTPGTPAASPAVPSVPAGHIKIAEVYVDTGAASLDASNITDYRLPAGYGRKIFQPSDAISPSGDWSIGSSFTLTSSALNDQVIFLFNNIGAPCESGGEISHVRIGVVHIDCKIATAAGYVRTALFNQFTQTPTGIYTRTPDFTLVNNTYDRYKQTYVGASVTPLWLTGFLNPDDKDSETDASAGLIVNAGATSDVISRVVVEYYGLM